MRLFPASWPSGHKLAFMSASPFQNHFFWCCAATQSMKTLYRGAEGGIIILNAAVSAADGAVARANDLINNSPLNTLVNGVLQRSCTVACTHHV